MTSGIVYGGGATTESSAAVAAACGGGCSDLSVLNQSQRDPLFLRTSSPSPFLGSRSMVSFEDINQKKTFQPFYQEENIIDDEFDEYFNHQPEKKRRLTVEQVQFLEKCFVAENKLEPERKIQLAKDLGLQPRQVAIWFQNRRARWKSKRLEKDYTVLKDSYDKLKADYESLVKEKDKLKAEITLLSDKFLLREKEKEGIISSETSNSNTKTDERQQNQIITESIYEGEVSKPLNDVPWKREEDISSKQREMFDSDSPHYTSGVHMERGDSSYVFEHEQSDLSQDEEDEFSKTLFPLYVFPKLEDVGCSDPPTSSCNLGFSAEDHVHAFWSWPY